ncbi:MAG: hypothetical protein Fur0046_08060 [Cyanobacteria bacterium J069]
MGVQTAKQALTKTGWTQKDLQALVGCSRQPVTNFFKGEAIAQSLFIRICDRLGLSWQAIADLTPPLLQPLPPTAALPDKPDLQLDALVQEMRQQVHDRIRERCGTIRVLDMSHPVEVDELYTSVNILEKMTGRRHKRIDELLRDCDSEDFDRFGLGNIAEERVPALSAVQAYKKLIVLGKPGAGKTTFLKHLAIQCNAGQFEPDRLPIFVMLKDFAEAANQPSLLEYISHKGLHPYDSFGKTEISESLAARFHRILSQGRSLVLLDGLDEVRAEDQHRVIQELRNFSQQFWDNHFVITCRLAAWDYTFEKFTEVEIADFDDAQISTFARKWFQGKPVQPEIFLSYLARNSRIQQMTVSPLLLTLVCLAFEESGDCPNSRSELYKEGIDALLKKWDATRGIQRDQVYQKLSHQRKENLLSYIALSTFKQKDYFFKKSTAEQYIADYIRNLSGIRLEPDYLQLDSEAILRSIEAQHGLLVERAKGIYSFSHLTFHEYFTAREIVSNSPALEETLKDLLPFITEKRWREVFLLMTEMLRDSSLLLLPMKQSIDQILGSSERLQAFLRSVGDRAQSPEFSIFKPAAARAFCFDIDFDIDENRAVALTLDRSVNLLVCASFLTRMLDRVSLQEAIAIAQQYDTTVTRPNAQLIAATSANAVMLTAIKIALDARGLDTSEREMLKSLLHRLKESSLDDSLDEAEVKHIADEARDVAKHRHPMAKEWNFTAQEKELLKQYYFATKLLVDCLYSEGCMLAPELRQQLEASLFSST